MPDRRAALIGHLERLDLILRRLKPSHPDRPKLVRGRERFLAILDRDERLAAQWRGCWPEREP